jgi:hypothetical protein
MMIFKRTTKIAVLRECHYGLDGLPATVRVPTLASRDEMVKPIESATVDDLAFALLGLKENSSALHREIDAVHIIHDEARKAGALGTDIAIDVMIAAKEGK